MSSGGGTGRRDTRRGSASPDGPDNDGRTASGAPTPVRDSLNGQRTARARAPSPPRTLDVDGEVWTVDQIGSGKSRSSGAPLIEVRLAAPPREVVAMIVAEALDRVPDDVLADLIDRDGGEADDT